MLLQGWSCKLRSREERSKTMNIIETHNLTKTYSSFTAVSDVNLHIPKGKVYGLLGPNGAGKSTTMKMFMGLTKPTSGDRKSTRLNSSHVAISYAVFCLKKK